MAASANEYFKMKSSQERISRPRGEGPTPVRPRIKYDAVVLCYTTGVPGKPKIQKFGLNHPDSKHTIKTRFVTSVYDTFPSSFELEFTINWVDGKYERDTAATVAFWSDNLVEGPEFFQMNEFLQKAIIESEHPQFKHGLANKELSLFQLKFNNKHWTSNFRINADYGKTAPQVKELETLINEGSALVLICHPGRDTFRAKAELETIGKNIETQKEYSALGAWKRAGAENRNWALPPQAAFPNFEYYSSIMREAFKAELAEERSHEGVTRDVQTWLFEVDGPENEGFAFAISRFEEDVQLSAGEEVKINFDGHIESYKTCSLGSIDRGPISYACFKVAKVSNEKDGNVTYHPFKGVVYAGKVSSFDLQNVPEDFISYTEHVYINVSRAVSVKSFDRQEKALTNIRNTDSPAYEQIRHVLSGNDVGSLPNVNMFDGLQPSNGFENLLALVTSVMDAFDVSCNQAEVFEAMTCCKGGWLSLLGAPGVGKTTTFLAIITTILSCIRGDDTPQIVFHAPSNSVINRIVQDVTTALKRVMPANGKPMMITRFFNDSDQNKLAREYAQSWNNQRLVCDVLKQGPPPERPDSQKVFDESSSEPSRPTPDPDTRWATAADDELIKFEYQPWQPIWQKLLKEHFSDSTEKLVSYHTSQEYSSVDIFVVFDPETGRPYPVYTPVGPLPPNTYIEKVDGSTMVGLFHAEVQGTDLFDNTTFTPKDVGDRTYSIYHRMAEVSGLIKSPLNWHHKYLLTADWFNALMAAYELFRDGKTLQPPQLKDLITGLQQLMSYVLRMSEFVGLTSNLTGHECIREAALNPHLVIGDEQAKQTDADIWVVANAFPNANFLNAGDPYQLPPTVKTIKTCGYSAQFELSLLHRASLFGGTAVRLREQRRAAHDAAAVVENFYPSGFYVTPEDSPMESHDMLPAVKQAFKKIFNVDKPTVVLEVMDGQEARQQNSVSWHNQRTMQVTASALLALSKELSADDVGAVTMYAKQASRLALHLGAEGHARGMPAAAGQILQGTTEKIQGDERLVMVMDMVRGGSHLGHVRDERRLGAAASRARLGLVLVLDTKIKAAPEWRSGALPMAGVYSALKAEGRVVEVAAGGVF